MRIEKTYLLPVHAQSDLGLIMLKMPVPVTKFYGKKVLVTLAPDSMQRADAGEVDVCLEASPEMTEFYSCDDVFAACGGTSGMKNWLINTRQNGCHLHHLCDDDYCHPEKTWWETPAGALPVCWYHDPCSAAHEIDAAYIASATEKLLAVRRQYVIYAMRLCLDVPAGRPMSLYEVLWFAVSRGVHQHLPENMLATIAGFKEPEPEKALKLGDKPNYFERFLIPEKREDYVAKARDVIESGHQNFLAAAEQLPPTKQDNQAEQLPIERTEKTVKRLNTDPEPPASFMLRPKRIRWICEKYTQWVKKQPCVCCGAQADDPHHLIGHGQGGTATKAHDMFTFPLCRQHHDELHRDPRAWARQYGSQRAHVIRTLDKALALGVIE
ncbi:MAG: DUF968 domain-containing protein [Plesiomonas shigelloides]